MLFHCIYTSVQTRTLGAAEIATLVKRSRDKNASQDITGILIHVCDTFFQVLEGEQETLEELYARILTDPRHKNVTRIIFEPIARRYFGDTDMTLALLSPKQLATMLETHDPDKVEELLAGLDEGRAKRLLRAFSDGRWRTQIGLSQRSPAVTA